MQMKNRVVVTGMGVITPIGHTVGAYWDNLLAGKSGVGSITRFDTTNYPTRIAGEIRSFDAGTYMDRKEARRMDLVGQYAMAAAVQASEHARLKLESIDRDRAGVIIGSGIGGIGTFEEQHSKLESSGPGRVSPFFIPMMIIDMAAGLISMRFGFHGPNYATVSACCSSAHAIADAFRCIQRGEADIMLTGGSEATITPTALAGFCQAQALSERNDAPEQASRPFDVNRDGFVMGEGGAIVVLESYEHAKARGAVMYAELLGAGMSGDAHHMTAPHPDGYGARRAMEAALKDAGLAPEQIDYINAHATSTGLGDVAETRAIKAVFGDRAPHVPINATKSMVGHLLGAAGAVELITVIKSIETQTIHPTINLETADPQCDLDYVPLTARKAKINHAISNSFGFGGHNITLVAGAATGAR